MLNMYDVKKSEREKRKRINKDADKKIVEIEKDSERKIAEIDDYYQRLGDACEKARLNGIIDPEFKNDPMVIQLARIHDEREQFDSEIRKELDELTSDLMRICKDNNIPCDI